MLWHTSACGGGNIRFVSAPTMDAVSMMAMHCMPQPRSMVSWMTSLCSYTSFIAAAQEMAHPDSPLVSRREGGSPCNELQTVHGASALHCSSWTAW